MTAPTVPGYCDAPGGQWAEIRTGGHIGYFATSGIGADIGAQVATFLIGRAAGTVRVRSEVQVSITRGKMHRTREIRGNSLPDGFINRVERDIRRVVKNAVSAAGLGNDANGTVNIQIYPDDCA